MNNNFILRAVTLIILLIWRVYWDLNTKKAEINKPKTDKKNRFVEVILFNVLEIYILVNLFVYPVFSFHNLYVQTLGFVFVIIGFMEAMYARITLNDNWTQSYEYQIKKKHELIKNGIYSLVRHPIYGGLIFMVTGVLMVSGSLTFIPGLILSVFIVNIFARREERILIKHFGKKYEEYMKSTKKFIPFVY